MRPARAKALKQNAFALSGRAAILLTLPLHYQILIIKSSSLIQLKNEIVLTFVV